MILREICNLNFDVYVTRDIFDFCQSGFVGLLERIA